MNFRDDSFSLPSVGEGVRSANRSNGPIRVQRIEPLSPLPSVSPPGTGLTQFHPRSPSPRRSSRPDPGVTSPDWNGPASIRTILARRRSSRGPDMIPQPLHSPTQITSPVVMRAPSPISPLITCDHSNNQSTSYVTPVVSVPSLHADIREVLRNELSVLRVRELLSRLDAAGIPHTGINERSELIDLLVTHQLQQEGCVPANENDVPELEDVPTAFIRPVLPRVQRPSLPDITQAQSNTAIPSDTPYSFGFRGDPSVMRRFQQAVASNSSTQPEPNQRIGMSFNDDGEVQIELPGGLGGGGSGHVPDGDDPLSTLLRLGMLLQALSDARQQQQQGDNTNTSDDDDDVISVTATPQPVPSPLTPLQTSLQQLHTLCVNGDADGVKSLLYSVIGVDVIAHVNTVEPSATSMHPLVTTITHSRAEVLSVLLSFGIIDRRGVGMNGKTALYVACETGVSVGVVSVLLSSINCNSIIDIACDDGPTPLWIAASRCASDVVTALIACGASVDVTCSVTGTTPLWKACSLNHTPIVSLLIGAGCDVNRARPSDGVTPLWIACANNASACVSQLLTCPQLLRHSTATESHLTPFQVASAMGYHHIVKAFIHAEKKAMTSTYTMGPIGTLSHVEFLHGNLHFMKQFL